MKTYQSSVKMERLIDQSSRTQSRAPSMRETNELQLRTSLSQVFPYTELLPETFFF